MRKIHIPALVALLLLGGCFTVRETPYPELKMPTIPSGKDVRVQLVGFDAIFTSYVPTYGYATVTGFDDRYWGRGRYGRSGFYSTTVSTTEFIPHVENSAVFRNRATDLMEHGGCILQTTAPQYRVEVRFDGPFTEPGDGWAEAGWMLFTLLTADFDAQAWSAKLKVYDVQTGRLLFERDRVQRYEAVVWGPIPIFSPLSCEKTSSGAMKMWCLTALTDATVADALGFLSGEAGK